LIADASSHKIAEANGVLPVIGKYLRLGQQDTFAPTDVVANNCLSLLVNLCCNEHVRWLVLRTFGGLAFVMRLLAHPAASVQLNALKLLTNFCIQGILHSLARSRS
jgi:hypothetical protein